jgi:hypothetical protein
VSLLLASMQRPAIDPETILGSVPTLDIHPNAHRS